MYVLSIPLTLASPQKKWKTFPARSHQAVVQIQKLAVEVYKSVWTWLNKGQVVTVVQFGGH